MVDYSYRLRRGGGAHYWNARNGLCAFAFKPGSQVSGGGGSGQAWDVGTPDRRLTAGEALGLRRAAAFPLAARIEGVNGKMVAGTYEFRASDDATPSDGVGDCCWTARRRISSRSRKVLRYGRSPNGWRQSTWRTSRPFWHLRLHRKLLGDWAAATRQSMNLEGYLFPDTYRIPGEGTE